MMKKAYFFPMMEVCSFEVNDILTTSPADDDNLAYAKDSWFPDEI